MKNPESTLSNRTIFRFWLPLQATWLMMALEGPFLAAIIARLADQKFNLAAFGIAFSFAMIAESPIIMILSAANALAVDRIAFQKIKSFTYLLNILVTLALLLFLLFPFFSLITRQWMQLPEEVAELAWKATLLLIPWPAAIGYRRFYQGIMIRGGQTRSVAIGTVVRLLSMAVTALLLSLYFHLSGALVGAVSLSAGVVMEAGASRWMARGLVKAYREQPDSQCDYGRQLTLSYIGRFYLPLALTSMLTLALHPLTSLFMGKSRFPVESLAVLPVLNAMAFIFRSPAMAFQEVVIALLGDRLENRERIDRFGRNLGMIAAFLFAAVAFTPLARLWFQNISGLTAELSRFAYWPARLLPLLPLLEAWISMQRGLHVKMHDTKPVIGATIIQAGSVFAILASLVSLGHWIGVRAAATAQVSGYLAANLFLWFSIRKAFNRMG